MSQTDKGIIQQSFEGESLAAEMAQSRTADRYFFKMPENIGVQPAEIFQRRGDDGEIHQSGTQGGERLRRGMVGNAQADARISAMERA